MPHRRKRHLTGFLKKQGSFWPVVGVIGLRQVGKSTLFRDLIGLSPYLTLDDDDTRSDAEASAKAFLAKQETPMVIDEVQKCPSLFDAIKSAVDRKRIPGSFYLTGSSSFSAQKNIQESLTGRIGICELFPMTLAEMNERPFATERVVPIHVHKPRMGIEKLALQTTRGGMPVPLFSRDASVRSQYWKNWIATTLGRDLARVYGRGYDADFAEKVLFEIVRHHQQGVFPTLGDFRYDSRRTKKYLSALKNVFIVRSLPCHEMGIGKDVFYLSDSGMAHALMNHAPGELIALTLTRIFVLNEIMANVHYAGQTPRWSYFKSRKGTPLDLVWNNVPIKIIVSTHQTGWEERAVEGARKTLQSKVGLLVGPTDHITLPKKQGIGLVPWTHWS
ncbi:MAG: ATP-binding protein [Deltaproteobacteria bacterium]|nr:ATP-binding protein [Deltaproteobacteria bacterium]